MSDNHDVATMIHDLPLTQWITTKLTDYNCKKRVVLVLTGDSIEAELLRCIIQK